MELSVLASTVPMRALGKGARMGDEWIAARQLVSALRCGAVDNFVAVVDETDTAGRWKAVALASVGEVAATAHQVHGSAAQDFLDQRLAAVLDRRRKIGET